MNKAICWITAAAAIGFVINIALAPRLPDHDLRDAMARAHETIAPIPEPAFSTAPRPNILVILADDLGYADLSVFGSEIPTPHIDQLFKAGRHFTQFYTASSCVPTRAMLMTGQYPHAVGLGGVFKPLSLPWHAPHPSYTGILSHDATTIAEALKARGYSTLMVGKWHLGAGAENSPAVHGFDRSFSLDQGGASHFSDRLGILAADDTATYRENGVATSLPADFYSTDFYVDKMIGYLQQARAQQKPFFAYLALTAPHWPLQAPEDWIDRFKGAYDDGFAATLEARLIRAQAEGLIDNADVYSDDIAALHRAWDKLDEAAKRNSARRMEVYAAMVAKMDDRIGDLLRYLEASGARDDTLVVFLSDNGPDFTHPEHFIINRRWTRKTFDNRLENIGRPGSYVSYGAYWARVSAGPFKHYKAYSTEGGIRSPAAIHWPGHIEGGQSEERVATAMDVFPTFLDLAGATLEDRKGLQLKGRSLARMATPSQDGEAFHSSDEAFVFESTSAVGVRKGDFKLVYSPKPHGLAQWRLYDIKADPAEKRDLMDDYPQVASDLQADWEQFSKAYGVQNLPEFVSGWLFSAVPDVLKPSR